MKSLLLVALLICAVVPAAAQQFTIGGGYTTASNRDYHTGGLYAEAAISGKINSLIEIGAFGVIFHEAFGDRGQNVTGPAKPGFRFKGWIAPASTDPPIRPFLSAGYTGVRVTNDANHWPTVGGGFMFKSITGYADYLIGDPRGGRIHGWRYGARVQKRIGGSPFSLVVNADGTKLRGQATFFVVSGGVAYTFGK